MVEIKINEERKQYYIEKGYWSDATLLDRWQETVQCYGDREYLVDDRGSRYTYREMDSEARKLASFLIDIGVKPHDVVSFQIPVWSEFVIVSIGCFMAGAILHPLALSYEAGDLIRSMNMTEAKVYFVPNWFRNRDCEARALKIKKQIPSLEKIVLLDNLREKSSTLLTLKEILNQYPPVSEEQLSLTRKATSGYDVTLLLSTSGTTSGSKGVLLTHNNIIFSEDGFNKSLGLGKEDIMFMASPLNHATGFHHGIIAPMLMGAKTVLQQKFCCKEAIALMQREHCTYSMGATPFIYDILKELKESETTLPDLKFYLCGGAPVPGYMVKRAGQCGIKLCEVYGSTESVPHVFVRPDEALSLEGSTAGRAMDGIEVRIVDDHGADVAPGVVGEEISRGPNVFVGYLKDSKTTDSCLDKEGWFYSGDLCVGDGNGNIRIVGRKKDIIVRGGENLNSNEIDTYLEGCPGIQDHTIIGMPDERMGERICAYVVLRPDTDSLTLSEIISYLKEKEVPKRYWPEHLEITDKIPRTASGKVKKYLLKEDLERRMKL